MRSQYASGNGSSIRYLVQKGGTNLAEPVDSGVGDKVDKLGLCVSIEVRGTFKFRHEVGVIGESSDFFFGYPGEQRGCGDWKMEIWYFRVKREEFGQETREF